MYQIHKLLTNKIIKERDEMTRKKIEEIEMISKQKIRKVQILSSQHHISQNKKVKDKVIIIPSFKVLNHLPTQNMS